MFTSVTLNSQKHRNEAILFGLYDVLTHPPTPVVLSLEYGALSGSIAVTSFFLGSFYYSPDEADKVFPFQVFREGRARSERARKQTRNNKSSPVRGISQRWKGSSLSSCSLLLSLKRQSSSREVTSIRKKALHLCASRVFSCSLSRVLYRTINSKSSPVQLSFPRNRCRTRWRPPLCVRVCMCVCVYGLPKWKFIVDWRKSWEPGRGNTSLCRPQLTSRETHL